MSRREIYRHNRFMYFVTTSSFVTSQIKKKEKKGRKKLKCGTRIFRDNLNVSQKATQEKTNFSLRGGISSNTYNPLFQKKLSFCARDMQALLG